MLGYKRALLIFNVLAILGYLIVILFPFWQAVIVGSLFFLSWTAISLPATMELVAKNLPMAKRTMGVSMHSLVRRIPMALGPIVGGAFIVWFGEKDGVRLAFGGAMVLGFVSLVFQQLLIESGAGEKTSRRKSPKDVGANAGAAEKLARIGHPHPVLRTNSVCLCRGVEYEGGRNFSAAIRRPHRR